MKKKTVIIIITIAIIAIAVYFYLKSKKKAGTNPVVASGSASVAPVSSLTQSATQQAQSVVQPAQSQSSQSIQAQSVPKPPVNITPILASSLPANTINTSELLKNEFNFVNVIRDNSQGKAIIQFQPVTREFTSGESVRILSGPYAGVHKIWYIYRGVQSGAPVHNLYLDTPYITQGQTVPGKFYKA